MVLLYHSVDKWAAFQCDWFCKAALSRCYLARVFIKSYELRDMGRYVAESTFPIYLWNSIHLSTRHVYIEEANNNHLTRNTHTHTAHCWTERITPRMPARRVFLLLYLRVANEHSVALLPSSSPCSLVLRKALCGNQGVGGAKTPVLGASPNPSRRTVPGAPIFVYNAVAIREILRARATGSRRWS